MGRGDKGRHRDSLVNVDNIADTNSLFVPRPIFTRKQSWALAAFFVFYKIESAYFFQTF